jgi:hypothetical protein
MVLAISKTGESNSCLGVQEAIEFHVSLGIWIKTPVAC